MKTIKTTTTINKDRHLLIQLPSDLPIGNYEVLIVLEPKTQEMSNDAIEQVWENWVKEVQQMSLTVESSNQNPPQNDYETQLLEKYRRQGLELWFCAMLEFYYALLINGNLLTKIFLFHFLFQNNYSFI